LVILPPGIIPKTNIR